MKTNRATKAFTIIELMIAAAALAIVIVGVGASLYHAHQSWADTFDRVHGHITTDAYAAKRTFDSIVRKSSLETKKPKLGKDNQSIELYYYLTPTSTNLDGYALLQIENNDLVVTYGKLDAAAKQIELSKDILVHNTKDIKFTVDGANVRMTLTIEDQNRNTMYVTASAVRHSS